MSIFEQISNTIITPAHADVTLPAPSANQPGGGMSVMLMLAIFVGFMYLVVWRPQNKRAKEHRNLLNSLAKGDEVLTAGGILGRIVKLTDSYVVLALSDTTEITLQKSSIVNALPKGTLKSVQS